MVFTNVNVGANNMIPASGARRCLEVYGDGNGRLTLNGNCTIRIANTNGLAAGNEYGLFYSLPPVFNNGAGFQLSLPAGVTGYLTNDTALP